MSPDTIRLRHAATRADHIQVRARDHTTVAVHTRAAAAAVAIHRTAVVDHHPMAAVEVPRRVVAEAAIATRNPAPAPTAKWQQVWSTNTERATDNQPSLLLLFKDETDRLPDAFVAAGNFERHGRG